MKLNLGVGIRMDDMSEYMNQLNIASGEENLRGAAEGAAASAASAANLAPTRLFL